MATERLRVILEMVTGQYTRAASDAANATSKISGSADKASTATGRISSEMDRMGRVAKTAVAGAAAAAFIGFAKDSARAASDLNESVNAVNQIFGDSADTVLEFGKIAAQTAGLSAREFNQLATSTGALLTNMGFSFEDAGDESIRLAQRAADLASVFNTDVSDALGAINAGLRGETEPLRRFGVNLNDAAIRAKAVELGLADTTAEVDANGKAVGALELIYEQTSKVQGDFIRTSDEVANAQRTLAAEFENTQARFGQASLGPKNFFLSAGSDLLAGLNLIGLFGKEAKEAQQQAFLFEDALFAINEAAREGGDPLTRLADGLLLIASEGDLTVAQFEALALSAGLSRDQFEDFGNIVLAQARAMGVAPEILAELEAAILGTGDASSDAAPDLGDVGDEAGEIADEADRAVVSLKALTDQLKAQTNPVFGAVKAQQAYLETIQKIDEDGERTAEEILELAESAIDVASAFGDLDEVDQARAFEIIAESVGVTTEEVRDLLTELGFFDGKTFTATLVANTRTSGFSTDSGERGFGGGRAYGGPVSAGMSYVVGERGPEWFTPTSSGRISAGPSGGGDNYVINVTVPLKDMDQFARESARAIEDVLIRRSRAVA